MKEINIKEELKEIDGLSYRDQLYELYDLHETLNYNVYEVNHEMHELHNKYQNLCRKKFAEELNSYINSNFKGEKPIVDEEGNCTISYKGIPMDIEIFSYGNVGMTGVSLFLILCRRRTTNSLVNLSKK